MSTTLDNLFAQYAHAAAATPKRAPRAKRDGSITPEAQAVRVAAVERKAQEARAMLDAADRDEERAYYRRVGRLAHIAKRQRAVRDALGKADRQHHHYRATRLFQLQNRLSAARDAVFALPIMPRDLQEGGRFYRRAVWLGLKVGMTAADIADIVAIAVELCYLKGQTATVEPRGAWRIGPSPEPVALPTIGAMYRNLKIAFHAEVERFRRNKSAGAVALHSLDALQANMGDAWWEANEARLTFLGYGFDERATDLDALYPATMVPVTMAEQSRKALQWAASRRKAVERLAGMERSERDMLAQRATAPAGTDRRTFEADRIAIRILINGGTVADIAKHTNTNPATVTARLLALEGQLGATVHSGQGSEPVHSTMEHDKRTARHDDKAWTRSKDGTIASPVVVTTR